MKKNIILATLGLAMVAFSSCKKETLVNPGEQVISVAPNQRLLISEDRATDSRKFYYHADKTLKSFTWGNGQVEAKITYLPNKMLMTHFLNGAKHTEYTFELSGGIAQKCTSFFTSQPDEVFETRYSYNEKKLLVKVEYFKNGVLLESSHKTYNSDDDMIINETRDANGNIVRKSEYEYDLALFDKSGSWGQSDGNGTGSIFPKWAKHMVKKITSSNGTVYNFSYTTDPAGYILTSVLKDGNGNISDSCSYIWE